MRIITKHIDELLPASYNPRKDLQPDDPEFAKLRKSIEEFDYIDPVIWNERTGHIVGGHQRLKVLKDLGREKIKVSVVDLTEEKEKALNLALNKIQGEWDIPRLEDLLAEIETFNFDDVEITGFNVDEIEEILRGSSEKKMGLTDPDDVPEPPEEPITKPGDIWLLGEHRVMCGDSADKECVQMLLNGEKPMLMITDPPYGVNYDPPWRQRAAESGHLSYAARRVGEVDNDDKIDWSEAWQLSPCDIVYCWHAGRHASSVQNGLEQNGFEIRSQIIWSKPHFPISRGHYHWRHEPCWYAVRKGKDARWIGGRDQTTVWEISLDQNVIGGHSTQKPVECMARALRNHEGDVYDPFVGTGTTIIAATQLNRRCFAMEINPHYCDVAVKRWEGFTGQSALFVKNGEIGCSRRN